MKTLPEWPDADDYLPLPGDPDSDRARAQYERARADAAMARLRVAVEALKWHAGSWTVGCSHVYTDNDRCADHAANALAAIGPLPEA